MMTTENQPKVILISFTIMLYQAIANTDLAFVSQLALQKGSSWAGPLLTCLLFLGSGLGSLYNKYIDKYPYRYCIFFGSFGYIIFIALGIIFTKLGFDQNTYFLIFIGAFAGGLIASVFYNSTYNYVNSLAQEDGQYMKYFGINIGIIQFCNMLGNLISAILIKQLGQLYFLGSLDIVILAISLFFLCFSDPHEHINRQHNLIQQGSQIQQNSQIKQLQLINNLSHQDSGKRFNPMKLWFILGITGIIVSFIYTQFSTLIYLTFHQTMSAVDLNQLTFTIFIFEGIGQIFGGLYVVFYSMRQNISYSRTYLLLGITFMLSVLLIYIGHLIVNQYVISIGALIAGFTDCSCMALALSIAGKWQKKGVTAFNLSQTLTICISGLVIAFSSIQIFIGWICIFFLIFSMSIYKYRNLIDAQN